MNRKSLLPLHQLLEVGLAFALAGGVSTAVCQEASSASAQQTPAQISGPHNAKAIEEIDLPDSPGAVLAQSETPSATGQQPGAATSSSQGEQAQSNTANASQNQVQQSENSSGSSPQKPVGTAAAEAPNASGIAASQPAGVAIAPAKQRRVRTLVLKTGAILGACVAIGTVVGLTAATPSKPPGAH